MMRVSFLFFLSLFFLACAGNPPAWWNPSGAYSNDKTQDSLPRVHTSMPSTITAEEEEPSEQTIDPAYESYEEMRLTPLPETEEEDFLQSSETDEAKDTAPTSENTDFQVQETEESLPDDGTLPPPSVLE